MKERPLILIPLTEYGIPSGNYDGSSETSFGSTVQKGVTYYLRNKSFQTIRFQVDDFVGTIDIYGSLDTEPSNGTDTTDWFNMYTFPTDDSSSLDGSTAVSADFSVAVNGRVTWIKAIVNNFTGGTITQVTMSY